jgi:hypothetical protein
MVWAESFVVTACFGCDGPRGSEHSRLTETKSQEEARFPSKHQNNLTADKGITPMGYMQWRKHSIT